MQSRPLDTPGAPIPYPMFEGDIPDYYRTDTDGTIVPLTKDEYKKAMHDEWTVKGVTIPSCKHVFVPGSEPQQRNCESCWFAFFQTHGTYTKTCDDLFHEFGVPGLIEVIGPKATKFYLRFMGALAHWKQMAEKAGETNGNECTGGTTESRGNDDSPSACGHFPTTANEDWGGINPLGGGNVED